MANADLSWTPSSWRHRPALQQPAYADPALVASVLSEIRRQGPLVPPDESTALRRECAAAASGEAFIIQVGDCAESLDESPGRSAEAMSSLIADLAGSITGKTVAIARIAGQFAKPRSEPFETRDGLKLPSYCGDAVNGLPFDPEERRHDPARLTAVYRHSAKTLSHIRRIGSPIFTSHEALILPYEEALAFQDGDGRWWSGSGHMLWIGDRTRQVEGAHVAFASGIENAVGVKCGPTIKADELVRLADALDSERVPGKLLLIARFGADRIQSCLPDLLRVARREGLAAGWMIDPMHGNTRYDGGRKQRRIADMIQELRTFFEICGSEGVEPAGIHLEAVASKATECIGTDGRDPMADFPCDPRLNSEQAVELVKLSNAFRSQVAHA
jgi:3-deoxy-7-phosphoheptulonate synthase